MQIVATDEPDSAHGSIYFPASLFEADKLVHEGGVKHLLGNRAPGTQNCDECFATSQKGPNVAQTIGWNIGSITLNFF
eukprot:9977697-Ditylum_brightwellii.AAC.1